jgi:DNA mismatch endonuclease (patch repair protein)
MVDKLTPEQRSKNMRAIGQRNTKPEMAVRKLLHSLGYRYRLHRKDLPGRPDLVFPSRRAIIFIHGCFWHGHGCAMGKLPQSRTEYWLPKIAGNQARDASNSQKLRDLGWRVLELWECETKRLGQLEAVLKEFLGPPGGLPPK